MYVVCLNCGREFAYSWDEDESCFREFHRQPIIPPLRQLGNIVWRDLQPTERT